jgi:uncharacterized protein YbjT (DUF2867 family)
MYAITGITGKVGGELARALLAAGAPVRAIVRNAQKGEEWAARGCEVAVARMEDHASMTEAFRGATAVFVLPPPEFDPEPGYPEARAVIDSVARALLAAQPGKVLCLSTIGADAMRDNLLSQRTLMETVLRSLPFPLTLLRPAWFLENAAWDVESARNEGVIHSLLQPLDKPFPMVAAADVGSTAARLIQDDWVGLRIVELEGPTRVSPKDLAYAFSVALKRPVRAVPVPRETWEALFRNQGMKNPVPRIRMLDGFNEGWIEFQDSGKSSVRTRTTAGVAIARLVERATT